MVAKLLLTSAHEDLKGWEQALLPYGLIPIHVPMFDIHYDTQVCQALLNTPVSGATFLIITSQYAAAALPLAYYQQFTHIFVMGQTTADRLPQGASLPIVPPLTATNSEKLFAFLLTQPVPKKVILLQGKNAHPYLLQQLGVHGFEVQQYAVYERVPRQTLPNTLLESIQTNSLSYIWFASISASEIFWQLLPLPYRQQCLASCILCVGSARIAAFWKDYGPVQIATAPTRTAFLALLQKGQGK